MTKVSVVEFPPVLVREVIAKDHVRNLLLMLVDEKEPLAYSVARERLNLHPELFQRAVDVLSNFGLIWMRAPDAAPAGKRRYRIFLEASQVGRIIARTWKELNKTYVKVAREEGIPAEQLTAALAYGAAG